MDKHKLTNADEWFLKKGQIDSISRSRFAVGDEVVVCDRQHVMLVEFYDGECPTCHSKKLVHFSRENVEPGTLHSYVGACPKCNKNVTIIFSQHGMINPFVGKCPNCKKNIILASDYFTTQKILQEVDSYIRMANKMLGFMLVAMIMVIILLNYRGIISNQDILTYAQNVIVPRSLFLVEKLRGFLLPESMTDRFVNSFIPIVENTNELVENGKSLIILLAVELKWILLVLGNGAIRIYNNTCDLFLLFKEKTESIIDYFGK